MTHSEKMSKRTGTLNLDKCISSKLWYTSLNVFQANDKDNCSKNFSCKIDVDFVELEDAIKSLSNFPNQKHCQWIAYILFRCLIDKERSDINFNIKHIIQNQLDYMEMKHAIELCEEVPDDVHEELLLFLQNTDVQYNKNDIQIKKTVTYLKKSIYIYPEIACWIMNKLLFTIPLPHIIKEIQDVYFSVLKICLEHIPKAFHSYSPEAHSSIHVDHLQTILCLLSRIDIDVAKETEFFNAVYPVLIKVYNIKDIEVSLYSRKNGKLFNQWLSLRNKAYSCSNSISTLDAASKISETIFKLTDDSKVHLCKRELLKRISMKGLHWLYDILNICYIFTINRKYNMVESLMSCDLLKTLYPVLLFKVLNDYSLKKTGSFENFQDDDIFICEFIQFLLEKCYHDLNSDYDLNKFCIFLKNHIKIVEYILDWNRKHYDTIEQTEISVKQILSLLQKGSVLSVLKATINIHDENRSIVRNLLTESEESGIFQAYCGITSALKAILLCEFYNTESEKITEYFTDMISHLSSLLPLSLRIEIMEDIFSLLFLRYEDFNSTNATCENDNFDVLPERTDFINKSIESDKLGFICNKYALRDILRYLWQIVTMTTDDIEKASKEENEKMKQLHGKLSILTSALTDAQWRLEFYMGHYFLENIGIPEDDYYNSSAMNKSKIVASPKPNFSYCLKNNTFFYKDGSTSDETKMKSDSGSESSLLPGNTKCRKHCKNAVEDLSPKNRSSSINLMLATKESMTLHCLWKSNFKKAQEIMKMFNMEGTQLDGEIRFAEALHTFKEDTFKYMHTLNKTDFDPKESSKTSTLENIRHVAHKGIQSSKYTSQFETFLASQESNIRMLNTDILNSNEILTFSVLDLSLTISKMHQISSNFCDVALKYLKLCETLDSTDYARFFLKIYQLFYDIPKLDSSVTTILCDAKIPLSIKEWKESNSFWNEFTNKYREFNDFERMQSIKKQSQGNNLVRELEIIKKLSTICNKDQRCLQNVYSHLQLVCTIIPDTYDAKASDLLMMPLHHYLGRQIFDLQTEPDELEIIASNLQVNLIHSILVNACPYISYLSIYNVKSHIEYEDAGCIVLNRKQDESAVKEAVVKEPNQCIAEILTELLQILRNVSSGQSRLDNSDIKSISDRANVQAILNRTSNLASLDLSELSVGNETLTFFLNVWNVMFLHASLTVWSNNPPVDTLRHIVSIKSIGYIIGDLGLVTLATLRFKLLGNFTNDLNLFARIDELNELAWQDLDLVYNPKVIFAMANEFYGTPEIRVYEAQTLNENLNDAVRDYIFHYTSISLNNDISERQIRLPDLIRQYQNALSLKTADTTSAITKDVNDCLSSLNEFEWMLEKNLDIRYVPPRYTYEITMQYFESAVFGNETTNTKDLSSGQIRILRPTLLQYLEGHCWLLSYLVQRLHKENPTILDNNCDNIKRIACLENLLNSSWIHKLKPLFNDNQTLTAIHDSIPLYKLWNYFEFKDENAWINSLEMLNALPDNIIKCNAELQRLKNLILSHVLSNLNGTPTIKALQYLYQIRDIHILAQAVSHNINKWPVNICEFALLHTLQHEHNYKLSSHYKHRMNDILCRLTIFHKMIPYCVSKPNSTWYDVMYCTEKIDPFQTIESLIDADQFELCLEWLECQGFSLEIQPTVIQDFFIGLLKNAQQDFSQALKFLRALPSGQSLKICKGVLKRLESTNALEFIANYLLEHCRIAEMPKYRRTLVGIDILKMLESKDKALYIHLIKEPLLMLEQLLMNCKFDSVQKILNILHVKLQHPDVDISNFEQVISFYAKKSLDFRISLQRDNIENTDRNSPRSNFETENEEFIMPINVPTKEEWIPNDKARECSCCKAVIFSMFNRRHHCRRCGRVVCAMCSQHRMQVSGYPSSVLVRVCDDCKRQTVLQMRAIQDVSSTPSSEVFDYWRLTRDEKYNRTIRDEFSFEYAPNISLCLAILNLHSDHKMYNSFLLDRCDEMKHFLQPVSDGRINPEVDHMVIIKMIRSLLVASKVKCAKLGFNTGLAHCDRFLSQVDLIATLVQSDCLTLIPTDDLDEHTLRKLRDLLTEKEQWTLALDVSTKAGLDVQGVWAAWGKACLKMGCLDEAKDKFCHCLDKVLHDDLDDWIILTYSNELTNEKNDTEMLEIEVKSAIKSNETSRKNREKIIEEKDGQSKRNLELFKCRPLKDPPLLTEILQILDNLNIHRSQTQHTHHLKTDVTQEILRTLNDIKTISQNHFTVKHLMPANQTVYYQESLYYLLTYGSYNSILQFFLKYKEFDKCLTYILENDLEPDLFLNGVYLCCLKNGNTEKLHDAMKTKDPSLLVWRKYLMLICHAMEKKQYWHTLYQIQLFMKDCIRASMTCIRFYFNEANTYLDLHNRIYLLHDAQRHLESELQIENLNKRRKSVCSVQTGQGILTMEMEPSEIDRHINTICRQIEIAKFLANCEKEGRTATEFLNLFPDIATDNFPTCQLPTLFGNQQQKTHLAVLAILCGRDIEEGFGIAFRIIQDYNLPQQKVYSLAGHVLALKDNVAAIEQLIKCCRSSGAPNTHVISDCVLTHCVKLLLNRSYSEQNLILKSHIDILIRQIIDTELRINAYIESKQLKAAYLLAVKYSRAQDIRRILKESDRLGQNAIKAICLKWLQQEPKE